MTKESTQSTDSIASKISETNTTSVPHSSDDGEVQNKSGPQNWIIYITIMTIMSFIVILIIVFTTFDHNKKNDKRNYQNKLNHKKQDVMTDQKVDKPKKKSPPENAKKEPSVDTNNVFTVTFDHDDEDNNNAIKSNINSNTIEEVAPQLVERVTTEPFLVTKHPSLEPEEKPVDNNLFTRIISCKPKSRTC